MTEPRDLDELGRGVREAWLRWALTQPNPKPSWLLPYDELSEPDKEADRQIGAAVWQAAEARVAEIAASNEKVVDDVMTRIVDLVMVGDALHHLARHGDTCGLRNGSHCTCAMAAWERLTELRA